MLAYDNRPLNLNKKKLLIESQPVQYYYSRLPFSVSQSPLEGRPEQQVLKIMTSSVRLNDMIITTERENTLYDTIK